MLPYALGAHDEWPDSCLRPCVLLETACTLLRGPTACVAWCISLGTVRVGLFVHRGTFPVRRRVAAGVAFAHRRRPALGALDRARHWLSLAHTQTEQRATSHRVLWPYAVCRRRCCARPCAAPRDSTLRPRSPSASRRNRGNASGWSSASSEVEAWGRHVATGWSVATRVMRSEGGAQRPHRLKHTE